MGTFTKEDLKAAESWTDCVVSTKLRSMGYNMSHTSDQLDDIIFKYDEDLAWMGYHFAKAVKLSESLSRNKKCFNTDEERHEIYQHLTKNTKSLYDEIQNKTPTQALMDKLGSNSNTGSIEPHMGFIPPFFSFIQPKHEKSWHST